MKLGEWIKQYRKEHGLSMQAMADLCGFSKAYIGMLEKGVNPTTKKPISPTIQTFQKIADSIGIDINDFIMTLDSDQPITLKYSSPTPPAEEFTQAEKGLVYAYREAPDHIQQSVDAVLGPYKPDNRVIAAVADEEKTIHYLNPYVGDYSPNNPEIPNFKTPKELKLFLNWLYKPEYVEDTYQYIKALFTLIQARATAPNTSYTEFIFSSIRSFILEDPNGFMRDFVYAKDPNKTIMSAAETIYDSMSAPQENYLYP